jgi:hypothetical protein
MGMGLWECLLGMEERAAWVCVVGLGLGLGVW